MTEHLTTAQRIVALMDHLGLETAHVATQVPGDIAELVETAEARIAGVVLIVPTRLDAGPFAAVSERLLMISGDKGLTVEMTGLAAERLPGAVRHVLANYEAAGWSDVVADRADEITRVMAGFLEGVSHTARLGTTGGQRPMAEAGEHAGLTWRLTGQGPPLLLLPFFLAPSQWEPAIAELAQHFLVVQIGGPHIGGIAALEDRARAPTYRAMFRTLVDLLAPPPEARVLDVGCGSGALDRLLASMLGPSGRIVAADLNPFFLKEARALAERHGLAERISFMEASATDLPFEDGSFDCAFSITVLEECDADRAIAELTRVVKPGGRVGIVVRAIDVPQWWNLELPQSLAAKVSVPPQSVAVGGVADRSLYERMQRAGLTNLQAFPSLITLDRPDGPIWRYREDAVLSQLTLSELDQWRKVTAEARAHDLLMQAHAMHAAVAKKPLVSSSRQ
ncbi:MAG: class I SAM-dependent methyltransferase [Hyphomicrobiaceae bacterium]